MKLLQLTFFYFLAAIQCHATITWHPPQDISSPYAGDLTSVEYQAGMDAHGNVVAVWQDVTTTKIFASALISGVWTSPASVSSLPGTTPVVAVAANGNAVALWYDSASGWIFGAMKPFGSAWTAPVPISAAPAAAAPEEPRIGVDATGNAVAVWKDLGASNIFSARLPFGSAWSGPINVSLASGDAPEVAVAANGNTVAVWGSTGSGNILSSTLAAGSSTWSSPINVSAVGGNSPHVGVDATGNAVAIWYDTTTMDLFAGTLLFGGSWSSPTDASMMKVIPDSLRVAVNGSGIAAAVWVADNSPNHAYSSRLISGAWETPVDVSGVFTKQPDIGIAANGDVTIASRVSPGSAIFVTTRELTASDWTLPVNVSTPITAGSFAELAVSPNGDAVVIWTNGDVYATTGLTSHVLPTNLKGTQVLHRFPAEGDLINELSWTFDSSFDFFRIYRDTLTNLIKETRKTKYKDHQRKPGKTVTYYIVAVDVFGIESAPVSIVVAAKKL